MTIDEKTYKDYDVVYRYKKSILLDRFFAFVPFVPIIIVGGPLIANGNEIVKNIVTIIWLTVSTLFFLSDKIFKGASLGKRIYKIKLVNKSSNKPTPIRFIALRRFLEIFADILTRRMSFLEKDKYIENATKTKIVNSTNENDD